MNKEMITLCRRMDYPAAYAMILRDVAGDETRADAILAGMLD